MNKKKFYIALCTGVFLAVFLYSSLIPKLHNIPISRSLEDDLYLVNTPGCTIPKLDPFDASIRDYIHHVPDVKCLHRQPSVTYQDGLWLRINKSLFAEHFGEFGHCYFKVISRVSDSDKEVILSKPTKVDKDVKVSEEFLWVGCNNKTGERKYQNCHAFVQPKSVHFRKNNKSLDGSQSPHSYSNRRPNVMFIGVDSVSRLNMIRQLNRTRHFLVDHLGSIDFQGYNKVADNTFVNVVPLLANKYIAEVPFDEETMRDRFLDDFGFVWEEFADKGYLTLLAEDSPSIATFNYLKAGFKNPPTHYYLRPFNLAMERAKSLWYSNKYCFVDRLETQIVLDYFSDFLDTNQNKSYFAYTFLTRMSHDHINNVGGSDFLYLELLKKIERKGHLDNTILFFFSDHGMRFGEIRKTYVGKMEERLPMMFIYLPQWFKQRYPQATGNIQLNAQRLTTPFDIYYTLRDILNLNFEVEVDSKISGRGISLFAEVPFNRTCEQAEIAPHWCTCQSQVEVDNNNTNVLEAANFAVEYINNITAKIKECARLNLKSVNHAWRSGFNAAVLKKKDKFYGQHQSVTDYQIMFTAYPGGGQFETTVRHFESKNYFWLTGEISRINLYGSQSHCVSDTRLKKYCYCI